MSLTRVNKDKYAQVQRDYDRVHMCQTTTPISQLWVDLLTSSSQLLMMEFQMNIGFLESSTCFNPLVTGACRLKIIQWLMSTTHHILADHHNVVGWWLVLNYMRTPLTHYYLESSRRVASMETQLNYTLIHHHSQPKVATWPNMPSKRKIIH